MIKRSLFLLVACTVMSNIHAMENVVQLPSAHKLRKYLCHAGFDYFVNETNIDKRLGGSKIDPLELFKLIEVEVHDHLERIYETAYNQVRGIGFPVIDPVWITKESVLKCILHKRLDVYQALFRHERSSKL